MFATTDTDGSTVERRRIENVNRSHFDFDECHPALGWIQWDTHEDGPQFGIWVHVGRREIVTFVEGAVMRVRCPDHVRLGARLEQMEAAYGPPPPVHITRDDRGCTEIVLGSRVHPYLIERLKRCECDGEKRVRRRTLSGVGDGDSGVRANLGATSTPAPPELANMHCEAPPRPACA